MDQVKLNLLIGKFIGRLEYSDSVPQDATKDNTVEEGTKKIKRSSKLDHAHYLLLEAAFEKQTLERKVTCFFSAVPTLFLEGVICSDEYEESYHLVENFCYEVSDIRTRAKED